MTKSITLSFIFSLIIYGIGIAINSIATYFSGFGIPFIAVLVMAVLFTTYGIMQADSRKRLWDLLILNMVSVLFGLILFCVFEWALTPTIRLYDFVNVFTNVYSVFSLIFFIYTIIRLMFELNNKTFFLTELILGNYKPNRDSNIKKENRQPKEVRLGDVEQKPIEQPKVEEQANFRQEFVNNSSNVVENTAINQEKEEVSNDVQ